MKPDNIQMDIEAVVSKTGSETERRVVFVCFSSYIHIQFSLSIIETASEYYYLDQDAM